MSDHFRLCADFVLISDIRNHQAGYVAYGTSMEITLARFERHPFPTVTQLFCFNRPTSFPFDMPLRFQQIHQDFALVIPFLGRGLVIHDIDFSRATVYHQRLEDTEAQELRFDRGVRLLSFVEAHVLQALH